MQYLFLLYIDENLWAAKPQAEKQQAISEYMAYGKALRDAGAFIAGEPLEHSRNGKRIRGSIIEDGPYADSKEQLGGFYQIEAKNLDDALEWASRCPAASYGHVEIRPLQIFA